MENDLRQVDRYEYSNHHTKYQIAGTGDTWSSFIIRHTTKAIVTHCRRKSAQIYSSFVARHLENTIFLRDYSHITHC